MTAALVDRVSRVLVSVAMDEGGDSTSTTVVTRCEATKNVPQDDDDTESQSQKPDRLAIAMDDPLNGTVCNCQSANHRLPWYRIAVCFRKAVIG